MLIFPGAITDCFTGTRIRRFYTLGKCNRDSKSVLTYTRQLRPIRASFRRVPQGGCSDELPALSLCQIW